MTLPAQVATFLTGVLAIFETCWAMSEKEGDLLELDWRRAINLVRDTPAPTVREASETCGEENQRKLTTLSIK